MEAFFESPWPALFVAGGIELILLAFFLSTGRGVFLASMLGVGLVALLFFFVERWVVTEREEVEGAIDAVAAALETNDVAVVEALIAPEAPELRAVARSALAQIHIRDARMTGDLSIEIDATKMPHRAKARFLGKIEGSGRKATIGHEVYLQRMEVDFRRADGGRWLVLDYHDGSFRK